MLRIALAQINVTVGDLKGNTQKILGFIERAKKSGADIVVFPELAVTGYPPEDLLMKGHFIADNLKALKTIAVKAQNITVIVGFVSRDKKGYLYNAAAIFCDKKIKAIYHKNLLPNYGVFDEKRYFHPGSDNHIFSLAGKAFGVSICEDIWYEQGPHVLQAQKGAQVLINISASPFHVGKKKTREAMLKSRAKKTGSFVVYLNLVGGQDELIFDGASLVIDPKGKIIASAKQFEEELLIVDLPLKSIKTLKPKGIGFVRLNSRGVEKKPTVNNQMAENLTALEEIYRALVLGTRDYILKNGFKKTVIGLSGGIDSSLVAVIATDAIGKENVIGVTMPSQFSSPETQSDSKTLAANLGMKCIEIPIKGVFDTYLNALEGEFKGKPWDIAEENLQARIRGTILMALSNKFGWLVLTTGNKSELATGYCTLYGDMAGGFAVIKDVPKTMVFDLVNFVNKKAKKNIIPTSVILRAPTAELRENQKDEDSLPAYSRLDPILKGYVEAHQSLKELSKKEDINTVKKVIALVDHSEYKRRQSPPGVKITPLAFGKDRRLPITNAYKEF